jgi:hypothetical protein
MAFQVSPGINVSEIDLTAGAQQVSVSDAAFAGPFQWGPALVSQNITSEDDLVSIFGKPDDVNYSYWFAAQSFLAYSNLLHIVRAISESALNATTDAADLSGTVNGDAGNAWTSNTAFSTVDLIVGQKVLIANVVYTVASVTNSTSFDTVEASTNAVGQTVAVYGVLVKNRDEYESSYAAGLAGYGSWAAKWPGELGNSLKVSVCSGANAFSSTLTGNVTVNASSNVIIGAGTSFATELIVGDYVTVNGVSLQVASIQNATHAVARTLSTKTTTAVGTRKWEYAALFDRAPRTSSYASARGGSLDEMHVVVVDKLGKFTSVAGTVLERYPFLSKAADGKNGNNDNAYYVNVLNRQSRYIWWLAAPGTNISTWGDNAAATTFGVDALPKSETFNGGQTDNANLSDGDLELAYDEFKNADVSDVSLVICGPASAALASYVIQNICEARMDCVAFVSPPKTTVVSNPGSEVTDVLAFRNQLPSSSYGFMDSGWKYQYDKYNDTFRWVPLNGDTAGIAARTDASTDPWYSPAGFVRGTVKNVVKLAWNPNQLDRDELYKQNVNPVVVFQGSGVVLYGDKTLLDRPSAFDRINVRRLFIVLEKTISRLARAMLFEFNDDFTRSQFRNIVEPYLRDVKARRGVTDYRVVCDDTNNTDEVIQENKFVGDIFVRPARSINFIQLNFVAVRNGVSFQEAAGAI